MKNLDPKESLMFFEQSLPVFLSKDPDIGRLIQNLKKTIGNEDSSDFHSTILRDGKELIKHILLKSIEFLSDETDSPKNRSMNKISRYIDSFTVFEEMLFGLNSKYRDHTLHSLWVYLYGHEFIMNIGGYDVIKVAGQMNITYKKGGEPYFVLAAEPVQANRDHLEAMWGMIAILHDFGYPVEAISNRPHEVFGQILEPFAIDVSAFFQFDIGSRIALLHQNVCDLLSTMYRPAGLTAGEANEVSKKATEAISKGSLPMLIPREPITSRDEAIESEFRIASVDKIHSAWSVMLAFKNITYLHESDYRGGGNRDYLKLLTKRDILYSILHHTSEEPKDEAVNRFQLILLLMDDIEEAMRFSRGGVERGIQSDFCDVKWEVNQTKTTIALDYSAYKDAGTSKFTEMSDRYKTQIARTHLDPEYKYVVELKFIDKKDSFEEYLRLFFIKDSGQVGDSRTIPSRAISETDKL